MNGHARMAIDNLAMSGSLVFDVDEASLVPGQILDIFHYCSIVCDALYKRHSEKAMARKRKT